MGAKKQVIIVGGGASGMVAAISAKRKGADVTILERNPRIGKKILATGNGRCNFTNINLDAACYHGSNPQFVESVFSAFGVQETIEFFEELGIAYKVEDAGKVFPMSDQASSILDVLLYELKKLGPRIVCDAYVQNIKKEQGRFRVELADGTCFYGDRVILATGGKAMPASGSDGNGYSLAERLGHTIIPIFPALVQLMLEGDYFRQIQGVKFVGTAELLHNQKVVARERGDILFANYGVSGPPILQISRKAGELLQAQKEALLKIILIDSMSRGELSELLCKRWQVRPEKTVEFSLVGLINKRLISVVLKEAGISDLRCPVVNLSAKEREKIVKILTDWRFKVRRTKGWSSAQVTAGGVSTAEINEKTLASKIIPGLYFAGEIVDVDGQCGGFNLQWAWSSGYLAGQDAAL
ncbi:MAG: NAD(P)/FAD-dependent oxidoreductase [Clostridia bacterium]|jgi:predicted Rossmann fold flavoprotein|nr:NAD(P)/FAD-dependent oxidoreductase [Clostridia bacterium]